MNLTEWWLDQFSLDERKLICTIFQPLGKFEDEIDNNFLIIKSESAYGFLDNLCNWLNKHKPLQNKIRLKANEIASTDSLCDLDRLTSDKDYKNWYYGRTTVLTAYKKYFDEECVVGFEWLGTDSIDIEQECYRLNGKKWRKNDSNFVKILNNHFQFYIADCRCDIIPILDIDIR